MFAFLGVYIKNILITLFLVGIFQICAFGQDKQIENINKIYDEANARIGKAEQAFSKVKSKNETAKTDVFLTEVEMNKGNNIYPGTATFRTVTKFYFTLVNSDEGSSGKIIKIEKLTYFSERVGREEWLADNSGKLIFYVENGDLESMDRTEETRVYFAGGKMIRFQVGDDTKTDAPIFRRKAELVQEILDGYKKLVSLFNDSM